MLLGSSLATIGQNLGSYAIDFMSAVSEPLALAGPFAKLGKSTDLLTWVLFHYVTTTFDYNNPFCFWMFINIPAINAVYEFVNYVTAVQGGYVTFTGTTYEAITAIVTSFLVGLYTLGPVSLAAYYFVY